MLENPLINGVIHDYASVELNIDGVRKRGVKSFSYTDSLEPGKARGTGKQIVGITDGIYDASGAIEFYLADWAEVMAGLSAGGRGLMLKQFVVVANYSAFGSPLVNVEAVGCRITKIDDSHQEGADPLTVKCDLFISYILRNGLPPFIDLKK